MEELISEHLATWTEAQIVKPAGGRGRKSSGAKNRYGIKKLRELILELAVRGKLVAQDPADEPASVLLERIAAEKASLLKAGKIKKQKGLPEITENKKPFDVPDGWEWSNLSELLAIVTDGDHQAPPKSDSGIPFLVIGNLNSGKIIYENCKYVPEEYYQNLAWSRKPTQGDLLYTVTGSYGIQVPVKSGKLFCVQRHVAIFKSTVSTPRNYLSLVLSSKYAFDYATYIATGIAQKTVPLTGLRKMSIPLPPAAERHKIVVKVDELMSLCDRLEKQQDDSATTQQALLATLLDALVKSADHAEFAATWQRIAEHFDLLFTTDQSIDQLKQAILQLAVMGKLVPQNPEDEPASVLLEKIAVEKARLVKEKKIKKQKPVIDFQGLNELKRIVPQKWVWVRLTDVSDVVRGGSPRPAGDLRYYDGKIPFLKVADVSNVKGKMVEGFTFTIKEAGLKKTRFINQRTVLLTNSGATLGIPAICDFDATFNDGIAAFVELSEFAFDEYLYLYLKSLSKWFLDIASRGQGQPNLNTDIIKATWFALPPLPEQHRIVTKVDELMTLCDTLKTRLQQARTTQVQLADALVAQAVA
ncbi:MAG: restriction endonuclease subunit S [Candidatus Electrothrix sp. GM3_4]|nr:restriction endonuclease subunit S [Candidatus Electrothrix sp. GM3_4]